MLVRYTSGFIVAVAAVLTVPMARAAEYQTMAAGACKSALPAFDSNIRSRPLAVQNEGDSVVFVTCAQQGNLDAKPTQLAINIVNNSEAVAVVNCTLVSGSLSPIYYVVSVTSLPGYDALAVVRPTAPATTFTSSNASWSCALPPGTGISRVGQIRLL